MSLRGALLALLTGAAAMAAHAYTLTDEQIARFMAGRVLGVGADVREIPETDLRAGISRARAQLRRDAAQAPAEKAFASIVFSPAVTPREVETLLEPRRAELFGASVAFGASPYTQGPIEITAKLLARREPGVAAQLEAEAGDTRAALVRGAADLTDEQGASLRAMAAQTRTAVFRLDIVAPLAELQKLLDEPRVLLITARRAPGQVLQLESMKACLQKYGPPIEPPQTRIRTAAGMIWSQDPFAQESLCN